MTREIETLLDRIHNRTAAERQQLLAALAAAAAPLHLDVIALKNRSAVTRAISDLVRHKAPEWDDQKRVAAWKHPLIESLKLPQALAEQNVPVSFSGFENPENTAASLQKERQRLRKSVIGSYIGVTSADFCLADSATLVLRTRPGQARSVSIVPSIHIAVITIEQIIKDLKELYTLLKWHPAVKRTGLTNCMTFISGPSKTADVEATMVHGAHGPREVYIYVITG